MKRAKKTAALVFLAAFLAAGCGGHPSRSTSLKIVADNGFAKATFRLRCDPTGGDIADPARACSALEEHPDVIFHPKPFTCLAESLKLTISGSFHGKAVKTSTYTCWTRQMELIDRLGIFDQFQAHIVPWPVRRDLFAQVAEIRPGTAAWILPVAEAEARFLNDPRPERMRIGDGMDNLVELWGSFHCQDRYIVKNRQPPNEIRRGTYARFTIDRTTHEVTSLWIGPKFIGRKGALAKAEDNLRTSAGPIHAYRRAHGTYVGMSVGELDESHHVQLKIDEIDPAWQGKNRFCVESTVQGRLASMSGPPLPKGVIQAQPCGLER